MPQYNLRIEENGQQFDLEIEAESPEAAEAAGNEWLVGREQERAQLMQQRDQALAASAEAEGRANVMSQLPGAVGGALHTAVDLGSAAAAGYAGEAVGGLSGLKTLATGGSVDEAVQNIEDTRKAFTDNRIGRLDAKGSQKIAEGLAPIMQKIESGADWVAEKGSLGNPYAAAAIKTGIMGAPELFAASKTATNAIRLYKAQNKIEKIADNAGIRMRPETAAEDLVDAANNRFVSQRGEGVQGLQAEFQAARKVASDQVDDLYEAARSTEAFVDSRSVSQLGEAVRSELDMRGFELGRPGYQQLTQLVDDMRNASDLLDEGVRTTAAGRNSLNELQKLRKRMSKRARDTANLEEAKGLRIAQQRLDTFLRDKFDQAAITGDPKALEAWRNAAEASYNLRQRFDATTSLKNMIKHDGATPETVRSWIVGATSMNAQKQAAVTIKKLEDIFGKDSPQMTGIRGEYLYDIVEPLQRSRPSMEQFVSRYEKFIKNNDSVVEALGINTKELDLMYKVGKSKRAWKPDGDAGFPVSLPRMVVRYWQGNSLARNAAKLTGLSWLAERAFGVGKMGKRQFLQEVAGIDVGAPLIPKDGLVAGALISEDLFKQAGVEIEDE
jgi:hypothetical protein